MRVLLHEFSSNALLGLHPPLSPAQADNGGPNPNPNPNPNPDPNPNPNVGHRGAARAERGGGALGGSARGGPVRVRDVRTKVDAQTEGEHWPELGFRAQG